MAASGKVAMVLMTAQAASITRKASGQPLPSPRRMPSCQAGLQAEQLLRDLVAALIGHVRAEEEAPGIFA